MKSFTERVDKEMKKRLAMRTDEGTEDIGKKGTQAPVDENVQVPGGAPGPKSPEEIKKNPNDDVNAQTLKEMGAKKFSTEELSKLAGFDVKSWWDTATKGEEHKITACMEKAKSFSDDPGAFCGWAAKEVGYR